QTGGSYDRPLATRSQEAMQSVSQGSGHSRRRWWYIACARWAGWGARVPRSGWDSEFSAALQLPGAQGNRAAQTVYDFHVHGRADLRLSCRDSDAAQTGHDYPQTPVVWGHDPGKDRVRDAGHEAGGDFAAQ